MSRAGRWSARGAALWTVVLNVVAGIVGVIVGIAELMALAFKATGERIEAWYERWRCQPYLDMARQLFEEEEFGHFSDNAAARRAVSEELRQRYDELHPWVAEWRFRYGVVRGVYLGALGVVPIAVVGVTAWVLSTFFTAAESTENLERGLDAVVAALQAQWETRGQQLSSPSGLLLLTVFGGGLFWIRFDGRRWLRYWEQVYTDYLRQQVAPIMRSCLSDVANDPQAPPGFAITVAPGLTSEIGPDKTVTRPEFRRLAGLVTELGASTIAISGTRGAGKSTLLKAVTEPDDDTVLGTKRTLRIAVRAPVSYDPREFVVHLFTRVCDAFLEKSRGSGRRSARLVGRIAVGAVRRLMRLVLGGTFIALWIPKVFPDFRFPGTDQQLPMATLPVLPTVGLSVLLLLCNTALERLRLDVPDKHSSLLVQKVERQRDRLSNLRVLTTESGGAFTFAGSSIAGKRFRQVSELPLTLPEITDAYRDLVHEIARARPMASPALIIGIDEIDRIANPEDVDQFLNEIKAIFAIPGCIYVVTVSADALAHFERRVSGIRGAVDSTFDDVIRVGTFSLDESREMLHQRLAGVPDFYVALCHCLSGGIPRDLVRCARSLVTQRKIADTSDREELTTRLISHEIKRLLEGFAHQAAALEPGDQRSSLLHLLTCDEAGSGTTLAEGSSAAVFAKASQFANSQNHLDDHEADQIARSAAASVAYHATVLRVFLAANPGPVIVEQLTAIHPLLAIDPDLAERQLAMLTNVSP